MSNASEDTPRFEDEELPIYRLFAELRAEVVRVSTRFSGQVARRVEVAADARGAPPSGGALITSVLVQSLNLLASSFGGRSRDPAKDEEIG